MKTWFLKKKNKIEDKVEARFQTVVDLIRDLDKKELNRLIEGMQLVWQGYNKVEQAKTTDEKEYGDINDAEKALEDEHGRAK